jgi:hypothetical protein
VCYCNCDGAATVVCNLIGMCGRAAPLVAGDARGGCVRGEAATHSILSDTRQEQESQKCKECALVHDKDTDTDELRGLHPNLSRKLAPITCQSGVSVHVPTRVFGVAILWVLYCIRWPSGQLTTAT